MRGEANVNEAPPGDENHAEPYAYVAPWTAQEPGECWNARGFGGAELDYAELLASEDPARAALDFMRSRREALAQTSSIQEPEEDQ
jgi:hypothetical protein